MLSVVKKIFSESVLKSDTGELLSLYHWTDAEFNDFEKGDIGFHLGTLHASHKRYQQVEREKQPRLSFYKECYVNLKSPVIIDYDPMRWDVFPTAYKLNRQGVLSNEDIGKLEKNRKRHW